jgi:4-amino-4-deoxy-L-arabinose transferase-like glycosyltransferase
VTRRTHRLLVLAVTVYAIVVRALPGIGSYDFGSAWDEGYYAIVARGAAAHALNLVYPYVFEGSLDRVLINKPPGFFWIGALALKLPLRPELALRLVYVFEGAASVPLFEATCRLYMRRRNALLAALVLATSPLHVAFSRVYQMDVLVLFYALAATYLLLRGVRRRRLALIYAAGPLLGLALLTKLWVGAAPVVALLPFLICEARRRRTPRLGAHAAAAMLSGVLLFAVWPLVIAARPAPYTGFLWMRPGSTVWDLLFTRYGSTRFFSDGEAVARQLVVSYLSLGHFRLDRGAFWFEAGLALLGFVPTLREIAERRTVSRLRIYRALPLLLWVLAYLPVQLGREHYLQYLVVLVPVSSVLVGNGVDALLRVPTRGFAGLAFAAGALALLVEPIRMVSQGDEILYRTHYREMGAYLRTRSSEGGTRVFCRYAPGLSFYTGGMEKPYPRRFLPKSLMRGAARFVDVKRSARDNGLGERPRRWVEVHCRDVSKDAGLPSDSLHALYDCEGARNPNAEQP